MNVSRTWRWTGAATLLFWALVLCGWPAFAGRTSAESIQVGFDPSLVRFEAVGQFERVFMPGMEVISEPGEPSVPAKVVRFLIPGAWSKVRVTATAEGYAGLGVGHRILPRQKPQVLSIGGRWTKAAPLAAGKAAIYGTDKPFPGEVARVVETRPVGDATLLTVVVSPFRYFPRSGRLELARKVTLRLRPGGAVQAGESSWTGPEVQKAAFLADYDLRRNVTQAPESLTASELPRAEYVVVTSSALASSFEPLVRWKNEKGVTAEIATTEWIYRHFSGADQAEQIREFLKYARREWGTRWVLLGGDVDVVPVRYAFAMDCKANYAENENNIPCDLYYADLDGDWNADGDDIYGEVDDRVDGFADLYVGRAPVENAEEAQAFVWKSTIYELAPEPDNVLKMLFLGEILWNNPYTDSGEGKNLIDLLYVPDRFDPITKLYESLGNESVESVLNALNSGYNFVNHDGHAWYTVMGVGEGYLRRSDVRGLTNGSRLPLVYSIGCWPAAFDLECIAEDFVNNPNGGAVAFIGNSRYGWGSPGNPHFGYSDRFDQQFYRAVFQEGVHRVGEALAFAKAVYMPFARQENVYRWCEYEINLLGDPEMSLWTDVPAQLKVVHPDTLPPGVGNVEVVVTCGGRECAGARVAISQAGVLRGVGYTNDAGFVSVPVDTMEPGLATKIVVTGDNLLPYEGRLTVLSEGAHLVVRRVHVEDDLPDSVLNPGVTSSVWLAVANVGGQSSAGGQARIRTEESWLSVATEECSVPALASGDSAWIGPFRVTPEDTVQNGSVAECQVRLPGRVVPLSLVVGAPDLRMSLVGISGQDSANAILPGESGTFVFQVVNRGLGAAQDLQLTCEPICRGVTVLGTNSGCCVPPGESGMLEVSVSVDSAATAPWFPKLVLAAFANGGSYARRDTVQVTVGRTGFAADCDDLSGWDPALSTLDSLGWQVVRHRVRFGRRAFYCGNSRTWEYEPEMDDSLVTLPFTVGQKAQLSFWCWYDVAIYGVDGLYVRVLLPDGSWKTLDFIGSGGALPGTLMGNDWHEYRYDLSFLDPGIVTRVSFKFVSDGDTQAEGVYLDQVRVMSMVERWLPTLVEGSGDSGLPRECSLLPPFPNPFNASLRVRFELPHEAEVHLAVYDLLGRKVKELFSGRLAAGEHSLVWTGQGAAGSFVPSGVYFVRMWSEEASWAQTRKVILLR